MRNYFFPVLSMACLMAAIQVQAADAVKLPSTYPKTPFTEIMTPVGLTRIKAAGEIGRRVDITIGNNLLALDTDTVFLEPFRRRYQASGYIGLGKLIDATVRFAAYSGDDRVLSLKERLVAEAVKTQEPDGYIGILVPENRLWGVYDIHEMSYLVLGLTHDYKYFGEEASLTAARKLADFIVNRWSAEPSRIPGPTGERANMYGVTTGLDGALLTLFEQTGDRRYLDFCINSAQYKLADWNSAIKMDEPGKPYHMDDERHTYIFMALCVAQLQLNTIEPSPRLLRQARQAMDFLTRKDGLLISGSCSLQEAWHDNQTGRGNVSESCATAYLTRLSDRELRLTGNPLFGNIMERATYNALFAAESPDGRQIRYFCPLEGNRTYFDRDTFCCPNNFRRIMAELPDMIYYQANDGVTVNLYTQSSAEVNIGGHSVTIRQETDYPTSGHVKIVLLPSEPLEFPLRLRIPGWCTAATLTVNGEAPVEVFPSNTFCEIRRTWKPSDSLILEMPMPWRWIRGRKSQEGRAALMRGPIVYCIGTAHNAEVLKTCANPSDLVLDPASLGSPTPDTSIRPDGLKATAKIRTPEDAAGNATTNNVVLTEFIDPGSVTTYVRLSDMTHAVDDELMNGQME